MSTRNGAGQTSQPRSSSQSEQVLVAHRVDAGVDVAGHAHDGPRRRPVDRDEPQTRDCHRQRRGQLVRGDGGLDVLHVLAVDLVRLAVLEFVGPRFTDHLDQQVDRHESCATGGRRSRPREGPSGLRSPASKPKGRTPSSASASRRWPSPYWWRRQGIVVPKKKNTSLPLCGERARCTRSPVSRLYGWHSLPGRAASPRSRISSEGSGSTRAAWPAARSAPE